MIDCQNVLGVVPDQHYLLSSHLYQYKQLPLLP